MNKIINPTVDHSVGIGIESVGITKIETIIDPIIGIDLGTIIGMTIEEITTGLMISKSVTDKMMEGTSIDKTIEETIIEIDKIMGITLSREIGVGVRVE